MKTMPSPINIDLCPLEIESAPRLGPTVLSSTISTGAGSAPARRIIAISFASLISANPSICVLPPGIFPLCLVPCEPYYRGL